MMEITIMSGNSSAPVLSPYPRFSLFRTLFIAGPRRRPSSQTPLSPVRILRASEGLHRSQYIVLLRRAHVGIERQTDDELLDAFSDRAIARTPAVVPAHRRQVQRNVVRDRVN